MTKLRHWRARAINFGITSLLLILSLGITLVILASAILGLR